MKKKLIWRLSTPPSLDEILKMMEKGVITEDEAKDMLFRDEENIPQDQLKEIKEEIKFLRDMVLELSKKEPTVIYKHIYDYIERYPKYPTPYRWEWINPWYNLCMNTAKSEGDSKIFNAMSSIQGKADYKVN